MADSQSNAPLRADAGPPSTGVIHLRTRLTADFTVISNALAQRRGSAVVVGVAVYIASLPDGTPVSIDALCEHFDEGAIVISRALRVLEAAGYLERRRERQPNGNIRTRTFFYDVPGAGTGTDGPPAPPPRPRPQPRSRRKAPATALRATRPPTAPPDPTPAAPAAAAPPKPPEPERPASLADIDPQVLAVFASLRRVDPRLDLYEKEAARLAPGIAEWLAAGVGPVRIVSILTERLPDHFLGRPVGILAYRLRSTPLPLLPAAPSETPVTEDRPTEIHRLQNCDGCDRAFRAPEPGGRCRDCQSREPLDAAC